VEGVCSFLVFSFVILTLFVLPFHKEYVILLLLMKTLSTKASVKYLKKELTNRERQSNLVVLENESGNLKLECTTNEIEDLERMTGTTIESDIIDDQLMDKIVEFFKFEELFEISK